MHQHAEVRPLARLGITNTFVTGGREGDVVLVEVSELLHSRALRHLADKRQRDKVVVSSLWVYKLQCLLGFLSNEGPRQTCLI